MSNRSSFCILKKMLVVDTKFLNCTLPPYQPSPTVTILSVKVNVKVMAQRIGKAVVIILYPASAVVVR